MPRGAAAPSRLLLLDTPDIDSDAPVNWHRADIIRQASDVLIAVLTQQKYNDAAVKQFFRKAAEADKPIIVLFNQVDLAADREYWPLWLNTFAEETGARPELVYVVPYDRAATAALQLPFYQVGSTGRDAPAQRARCATILRRCTSTRSRFARSAAHWRGCSIKTRARRPTWNAFATAPANLPPLRRRLPPPKWPASPGPPCHRNCWWKRFASGGMRGAAHGRGACMAPIGHWDAVSAGRWSLPVPWNGPPTDPLTTFRARERAAIVEAVEKLLDELDRLRRLGNETLRPRLEALLSGDSRAELLSRIEAAHAGAAGAR